MSSSSLPEANSDLALAPPGDVPVAGLGPVAAKAHDSLFAGEVDGLIVAVAEGEFPLLGTAAWIDWLLRGSLSEFHRKGIVRGTPGELTYLPFRHRERTLHLLLVGIGPARSSGPSRPLPSMPLNRRPLTESEADRVAASLKGLRLGRWGLSRADFPGSSDEILTKLTKAAGELALFD